jgi:cytidyltransferase-like protein
MTQLRVYTPMVADMFHYGHMNLLTKCRELHENVHLIVGVHSDESCIDYKRKPVMTMDERVYTIKKSGLVDDIICKAPFNPGKFFFEEHKIDIIVHAHTLDQDDFYRNLYKYASDIGMFKRLEYTTDISTSDIIKRIKDRDDL